MKKFELWLEEMESDKKNELRIFLRGISNISEDTPENEEKFNEPGSLDTKFDIKTLKEELKNNENLYTTRDDIDEIIDKMVEQGSSIEDLINRLII